MQQHQQIPSLQECDVMSQMPCALIPVTNTSHACIKCVSGETNLCCECFCMSALLHQKFQQLRKLPTMCTLENGMRKFARYKGPVALLASK